jgi:hypothetical protein
VIALAGRAFAGPFLLPLWSAPRGAGRDAVMVPGWRRLTVRALHFGQAEDFSARELLGGHPRYRDWLAIAGTDWNLYVATYEMPSSTAAQREAVERQIARGYRPEFNYPVPTPETPGLKAFMLAQALRTSRNER